MNQLRFVIKGEGKVSCTGWRPDPKTAGELAAHYLSAGYDSVTITDTEPEEKK